MLNIYYQPPTSENLSQSSPIDTYRQVPIIIPKPKNIRLQVPYFSDHKTYRHARISAALKTLPTPLRTVRSKGILYISQEKMSLMIRKIRYFQRHYSGFYQVTLHEYKRQLELDPPAQVCCILNLLNSEMYSYSCELKEVVKQSRRSFTCKNMP
jgi:hypothetical protein